MPALLELSITTLELVFHSNFCEKFVLLTSWGKFFGSVSLEGSNKYFNHAQKKASDNWCPLGSSLGKHFIHPPSFQFKRFPISQSGGGRLGSFFVVSLCISFTPRKKKEFQIHLLNQNGLLIMSNTPVCSPYTHASLSWYWQH